MSSASAARHIAPACSGTMDATLIQRSMPLAQFVPNQNEGPAISGASLSLTDRTASSACIEGQPETACLLAGSPFSPFQCSGNACRPCLFSGGGLQRSYIGCSPCTSLRSLGHINVSELRYERNALLTEGRDKEKNKGHNGTENLNGRPVANIY